MTTPPDLPLPLDVALDAARAARLSHDDFMRARAVLFDLRVAHDACRKAAAALDP
jgi:hypothetical protein